MNRNIETLDVMAYCCCGCGMEANQLHKGVPIPDVNPMSHYRRYKDRKSIMKPFFEHFHVPDIQIEIARRSGL